MERDEIDQLVRNIELANIAFAEWVRTHNENSRTQREMFYWGFIYGIAEKKEQ